MAFFIVTIAVGWFPWFWPKALLEPFADLHAKFMAGQSVNRG